MAEEINYKNMKSFRIPLFKKIIGALTKSFSNDDVAIVPREDGIYVAYKQGGSLVERKIYDERHNSEIAGMATGLGENIGSIRRTFLPGDSLRAEELASISSGEPTFGYVEASTPAEPYSTFANIRDGLDNGAISFVHNGTEYNNIAISLQPRKFSEQNIVNHTNYAGTSNATTSRGMTVSMGNLSQDQLVIKSLKVYLIAGETYTIKLYRNEEMVELIQEKTIVAAQTKFHDVILDDEYLFENGDAMTIIVEGTNFDYFYPSGTPSYTKSWADGSEDGVFDITNTLPIKLVVWPAIGLNDEYEDITPVIELIQEKITEETGVEVFREENAELWRFYFNAGFIQFDTASSSGSDLFSLLGFGAGRTTVYGEGYNAEDAPGKLIRIDSAGKAPDGFISSEEFTSKPTTIAVPAGTKKIKLSFKGCYFVNTSCHSGEVELSESKPVAVFQDGRYDENISLSYDSGAGTISVSYTTSNFKFIKAYYYRW
ncbi:MAG: hypothetical protein M0P99_02735 [Candidatus Cloacimonetes bacterium]|nr:hypothetical protein [Candidatus Cloacimonadota bacterium]